MLEWEELPFRSFVKNNMADIASPDWIDSQLNDYTSKLGIAVAAGEKTGKKKKELLEFLCKYESFVLLVKNAILKYRNLKLFRYLTPFLKVYQDYMDVDQAQIEKAKDESLEVYRKLTINPSLINTFLKTFEREKYFFFPGVVPDLTADLHSDKRPEADQHSTRQRPSEYQDRA